MEKFSINFSGTGSSQEVLDALENLTEGIRASLETVGGSNGYMPVGEIKGEKFTSVIKREYETYRDLPRDMVYKYADREGLNTETHENFREAAQELFHELYEKDKPIGILDLDRRRITDKLYTKLHNNMLYTYEDTKSLEEHLFSCEVRDNADIRWTQEETKILESIEQECAEKDCGYFRILTS